MRRFKECCQVRQVGRMGEIITEAASENNRQADTNASPCFALGCSSDLGLRSWCGCNVILGAENRSREHGGTK